jgi:rubrerythrin
VPGVVSRWIQRRVLASGIAFEKEAVDAYRVLREKLMKPGRCSDESLEGSLCHLLEEEELHFKILSAAAAGRLPLEDLERQLQGHFSSDLPSIRPLQGEELARWQPDLEAALQREEKTWIFYGNLRRMSKIPAVRRAFEMLAAMEREHVDILRKLLGLPDTSGAPQA